MVFEFPFSKQAVRNVRLISVPSLRHHYYPQMKSLLERYVSQHLVVINNSGLSLPWIVQPTLFNLKINVVLCNGPGCLCKETASVGLSRLSAAIEFLPLSVSAWLKSVLSYSISVQPCLRKVPGLFGPIVWILKKVPFGRMNCGEVNVVGRHGSPMRGGGLACGPRSQAQLLLLTQLRQQNQYLVCSIRSYTWDCALYFLSRPPPPPTPTPAPDLQLFLV